VSYFAKIMKKINSDTNLQKYSFNYGVIKLIKLRYRFLDLKETSLKLSPNIHKQYRHDFQMVLRE